MDFKKYDELKFEEALSALEEIVSKLENQTAKLDESLELYESGIYLVKKCSKMLDEAEHKVKVLSRGDNGEVILKDFIPQDNG